MKSGENTTRTVDQIRVTLGILRETIFLQTRVEFRLESPEKIFFGELLEVEESSRRDEKESRTLIFLIRSSTEKDGTLVDLRESQEVGFKFGIDNFLVTGQTKILKWLSTKAGIALHTEVPPQIEITNVRKNRRKSKEAPICLATVLVRSGGHHTEGIFELYDYSRGGYGGILKVPHEFSLVNDTQVKGRLELGANAMPVSCKLKRAQLISEKAEDWDSYQVGMEDLNESPETASQKATDHGSERRSSTRSMVQEHIELTSAINPDVSFRLLVDEASVTGFSGKLANSANLIEFPIGSSFQMESPPLSVTLQGFEGDRLRFAIQSGGINERLEWFKRISPYLLDGISHSVFDARDLLQVFCSSGALSSEYLKTQNTHRSKLLSRSEKTKNDQFWVHRWIHHNQDRNVTGHLCALKIGDNGWVMTDLVGSPEKEAKLPEKFIHLFFKSFSEFSLTNTPCPLHLYSWLLDHPFWTQFRDEISKQNLIRERSLTGYTRYSQKLTSDSTAKVELKYSEIKAREYDRILSIQDQLKLKKTYLHASFLDFDIDRFASPNISNSFKASANGFSRKYFEIVTDNSKWLAIFNNFPLGSSINRLPEAIWVFQLEGKDREISKRWPVFAKALFEKALELGIKPSSIRRIFHDQNIALYDSESATMENMLLHPSASALFMRNK